MSDVNVFSSLFDTAVKYGNVNVISNAELFDGIINHKYLVIRTEDTAECVGNSTNGLYLLIHYPLTQEQLKTIKSLGYVIPARINPNNCEIELNIPGTDNWLSVNDFYTYWHRKKILDKLD